MTGFLSAVWSVALFAVAKIIPALFRVTLNVATWLFGFFEAHHAAILACVSYLATLAFKADTWLLTAAHVGLAYFGTSAFQGFLAAAKGYTDNVVVDIQDAIAEEIARLVIAFDAFFPSKPAPATPANPSKSIPATQSGFAAPPKVEIVPSGRPVSVSVAEPAIGINLMNGTVTRAPEYVPPAGGAILAPADHPASVAFRESIRHGASANTIVVSKANSVEVGPGLYVHDPANPVVPPAAKPAAIGTYDPSPYA